MTKVEFSKLSKPAQAYLEGARYLEAFNERSLPEPQLQALAERSEAVVKEIEASLANSGAARDLNKGYRALRLNGDIKVSYGTFRAAKIADLAKSVGQRSRG